VKQQNTEINHGERLLFAAPRNLHQLNERPSFLFRHFLVVLSPLLLMWCQFVVHGLPTTNVVRQPQMWLTNHIYGYFMVGEPV
jgi:hypothetical protein